MTQTKPALEFERRFEDYLMGRLSYDQLFQQFVVNQADVDKRSQTDSSPQNSSTVRHQDASSKIAS